MTRIALVPMAAKPYHAGHDGLVRIAASECDRALVFVSTGDRVRPGEIPIYGRDMLAIWNKYIEPTLPGNVEVQYVAVPVQSVYSEIEQAEAAGDTSSVFVIYSDKEDILKYTDKSLSRSAPTIFSNEQIELRGVDRNETVNISGTKMRNLIAKNDMMSFISLLPPATQKHGQEIFNILAKNATETPAVTGESMLRSYVRLLMSN